MVGHEWEVINIPILVDTDSQFMVIFPNIFVSIIPEGNINQAGCIHGLPLAATGLGIIPNPHSWIDCHIFLVTSHQPTIIDQLYHSYIIHLYSHLDITGYPL